jgi:2-keto-4-pentenoate hydratase/2-oxohepta-3-ene-1,7-dioic acid hydratase in catechol pathway
MRFARIGARGHEIPIVISEGGAAYDLRPITAEIDGRFLAGGGIARAAAAHSRGELPRIESAGSMRMGAPIARPGAVICVGMNYAAHAAESGSAPPEQPIIFLKTPNTVAGPDDPVRMPSGSAKTDWEVELGIVIGRRAYLLDTPADAAAHIAGFVVADDLSERAFQLDESGGQWSKGKCVPGYAPIGPWLVTPDEVEVGALRLRSWINGEPRQDSTTADMIFAVDFLVWHLSHYLALEPGDLVLTGTPEGVALSGRFPYLRDGDIVEVEIEGLGRQRHRMSA